VGPSCRGKKTLAKTADTRSNPLEALEEATSQSSGWLLMAKFRFCTERATLKKCSLKMLKHKM